MRIRRKNELLGFGLVGISLSHSQIPKSGRWLDTEENLEVVMAGINRDQETEIRRSVL